MIQSLTKVASVSWTVMASAALITRLFIRNALTSIRSGRVFKAASTKGSRAVKAFKTGWAKSKSVIVPVTVGTSTFLVTRWISRATEMVDDAAETEIGRADYDPSVHTKQDFDKQITKMMDSLNVLRFTGINGDPHKNVETFAKLIDAYHALLSSSDAEAFQVAAHMDAKIGSMYRLGLKMEVPADYPTVIQGFLVLKDDGESARDVQQDVMNLIMIDSLNIPLKVAI